MKLSELKKIIREEIKAVTENIDNAQWMKITEALIKAKIFLSKSTFRFVKTETAKSGLTRKELEEFLMNGSKEGLWDEKVAKDYLMAIEGTIEKPLK
jgi:hypothetical protein